MHRPTALLNQCVVVGGRIGAPSGRVHSSPTGSRCAVTTGVRSSATSAGIATERSSHVFGVVITVREFTLDADRTTWIRRRPRSTSRGRSAAISPQRSPEYASSITNSPPLLHSAASSAIGGTAVLPPDLTGGLSACGLGVLDRIRVLHAPEQGEWVAAHAGQWIESERPVPNSLTRVDAAFGGDFR